MSCFSSIVTADQTVIRVGTRGSKLALWQANRMVDIIQSTTGLQTQIVPIETHGDRHQEGSLANIGGKGLFAKEIDAALMAGEIDCAVHSLKDLETELPEGIDLVAVMSREDARDALIGSRLNDLAIGSSVATCSVRRAAILRYLRPDLRIVPIRGNVQTRLKKLDDGLADATMLSYAGLLRLGLHHRASEVMPLTTMTPAVGQGAIAVTMRTEQANAGDRRLRAAMTAVHCRHTVICIASERAMLAILDGSCHTPIAGYATWDDGNLALQAMVLSPDGQQMMRHALSRSVALHDLSAARALGQAMGRHFRLQAAEILQKTQKTALRK